MSYQEPDQQDPAGYLRGRWTDRVSYSDFDGGFAHRPRELIVLDPESREIALRLPLPNDGRVEESDFTPLGDDFHRLRHPDLDVRRDCRWIERHGGRCEPNYVMFADVEGNPLYGNPLYGNPLYGNPLYGNPLYGNPLYGNPLYGNGPFASPVHARPDWGTPVYMSPLFADRYHAPTYRETGRIPTGARPAHGTNLIPIRPTLPDPIPQVIVLDTGIAHGTELPNFLAGHTGDPDDPDSDSDDALDPVAGHGTFIAGVLEQLVPGIQIESHRVLSSFGDGDVAYVRQRVNDLIGGVGDNTIVNMSFSGYADHEMHALANIVERIHERGGVVVASAGNDALGRPSYPAALPHVVGVGGLGANGPAAFSNWGPWIRACAPAVDLTSSFFFDPRSDSDQELLSPQPSWPGMPDEPNRFTGWARWTGTSFAGPIVAAAIAREMLRGGCPARDAATSMLDRPDLMRIPNLGAVVNLCPPLPPRD